MTAASYPRLLRGFPEDLAADYTPRPAVTLPPAPVCDGCGRDDAMLTESVAGTWACIDCIGDNAYDHEGDRR